MFKFILNIEKKYNCIVQVNYFLSNLEIGFKKYKIDII